MSCVAKDNHAPSHGNGKGLNESPQPGLAVKGWAAGLRPLPRALYKKGGIGGNIEWSCAMYIGGGLVGLVVLVVIVVLVLRIL